MSDHKMALLALKISDRYHLVWGLLCLIVGVLIFVLKPAAELGFLAMFRLIFCHFLQIFRLFLWLYAAEGSL